jgi:hypothetical protein
MSWRTAQIQCQTALRAWFERVRTIAPRPTASTTRPWIASRQPPALESLSRSGARRLTGSSYGQAHCGRIARTHE